MASRNHRGMQSDKKPKPKAKRADLAACAKSMAQINREMKDLRARLEYFRLMRRLGVHIPFSNISLAGLGNLDDIDSIRPDDRRSE